MSLTPVNLGQPRRGLPNQKVYAFDVDHTLWLSGPIKRGEVEALKAQGHILGLCGNWAMVTLHDKHWPELFSFIGPMGLHKHLFLDQISKYVLSEDYVMVGNRGSDANPGVSRDEEAAQLAGWRFISENDFHNGAR